MGARHTHKVGDYLMTSDISGRVFYASEMRKQWDGAWVHHSEWEPRHPQDFLRVRAESLPPREVRPMHAVPEACAVEFDLYIGGTSVPVPSGPAAHLFDVGIGQAEIGCSFVVR
jgi:hypothetical protein